MTNEYKCSQKKRLTIFASYDKNNIVNDYVHYYLKELKKISDVVFVADNTLNDFEKEKVRPFVVHMIVGKHGEYDFGSYKRGYLWAEEKNLLSSYDQLIYCNDSVFGPIYPLGPIFSYMESKLSLDFWGIFMTQAKVKAKKNLRQQIHVQSYFIVFNRKVINSLAFKNFMHSIKKLRNKNDIVEEYEIGLSQKLIKAGFHCGSYMNAANNAPHRKNALTLLKKGFPFLKRSLFHSSCLRKKSWCYALWRYEQVIRKFAPNYPVHFIKDYLYAYIGEKKLRSHFFILRFRIPVIARFFFQRKTTKRGYVIIKVLSLTIYRKRQST